MAVSLTNQGALWTVVKKGTNMEFNQLEFWFLTWLTALQFVKSSTFLLGGMFSAPSVLRPTGTSQLHRTLGSVKTREPPLLVLGSFKVKADNFRILPLFLSHCPMDATGFQEKKHSKETLGGAP